MKDEEATMREAEDADDDAVPASPPFVTKATIRSAAGRHRRAGMSKTTRRNLRRRAKKQQDRDQHAESSAQGIQHSVQSDRALEKQAHASADACDEVIDLESADEAQEGHTGRHGMDVDIANPPEPDHFEVIYDVVEGTNERQDDPNDFEDVSDNLKIIGTLNTVDDFENVNDFENVTAKSQYANHK